MLEQFPIQEISSIVIWMPLFLAGLKLKTGDKKLRLFFIFLLLGAITDGIGYVIVKFYGYDEYGYIHKIFQRIYLWFEANFFVWLGFEFLNFKKYKIWRKVILIGINMLFGFLTLILFLIPNSKDFPLLSLPYALLLVITSFLMGFALLQMAEVKSNIMQEPWFWILSGIFFYSFGSFFIDLLLFTPFGDGIWPIRNGVNIIQYGFFVIGLLKIPKRKSE